MERTPQDIRRFGNEPLIKHVAAEPFPDKRMLRLKE
jgi:hypothetical protein